MTDCTIERPKEPGSEYFASMRAKLSNGGFVQEDFMALQQRYKQDGSLEARNLAVEGMTRFIYKLALPYAHLDILEDLVQEAVPGVIKAFERYDSSRGAKFTTYAAQYIKNGIRRYLKSNGSIRIPEHLVDADIKINGHKGYVQRYVMQHGESPSNEQISAYTKIPLKKVEAVQKLYLCRPISLNSKFGDEDGGDELLTTIPDHDKITDSGMAQIDVTYFLKVLDSRQKKVVRLRDGLYGRHPRTLDEIAPMIEKDSKSITGKKIMCRERVNQIYKKAMEKMQKKAKFPSARP